MAIETEIGNKLLSKSVEFGTGEVEVRTSYLNNNDLGSGCDMHVIQHADGTISAYATNYSNGGLFDQNPAYADLAVGRINPSATVCMEYSAVVAGDTDLTHRVVKFFVYYGNGNGAAAPRQPRRVLGSVLKH